jgi:hypothetical protein
VSFPVTFSKAVTGFTASGVTVNSTSSAAGSASVTGSGANYTVTLSSITGDGTLGISVNAGSCTDAAGNPNVAAGPSATCQVFGQDGSIVDAKNQTDGSTVALGNKPLYYSGSGFAYIEEPSRVAGIRLEGTITATVGQLASLVGVLTTTAGGERAITVSAISSTGFGLVAPLGATNESADIRILDGIYVTVWGMVKSISFGTNSYVISDGSDDVGILVITQKTPTVTWGQFVTVTGAAGYNNARVIYAD